MSPRESNYNAAPMPTPLAILVMGCLLGVLLIAVGALVWELLPPTPVFEVLW